jgi:hypothetical protein
MLELRSLCIPSIFLFACGGALADDADEYREKLVTRSSPTWSVVGSLEGTYIDNAFFAPSGREGDFYVAPDVTIRLDGELTSDISYRVYARMELDAFSDLTDANTSVARVGVRLSRPLGEWTASLAYENRYAFDGIFEDRAFTGHDVNVAAARDVDLGFAILSPGGLITYRQSDLAEANRFRLELWLGIEVPIDSKWSLVSEPFFESFWFTEGLNSGRQDQIYSASLGLKYNISDNASLTTEAVYEGRTSNQARRDFDVLEIGPRLDFAF